MFNFTISSASYPNFHQHSYFRNDIAHSSLGSFAPFVYLATMFLPFFWFTEFFFKRHKPYNLIYFKVFKNSTNPFANDAYQVCLYNATDGRKIVSSCKEEVAAFLYPYKKHPNTFFVSYDAHHQGLTLRHMMRGLVKLEHGKFMDIKTMFMYRYPDIQENITYETIIDMLGLSNTRSRIHMYQLIFNELLDKYGSDDVQHIYKEIYA